MWAMLAGAFSAPRRTRRAACVLHMRRCSHTGLTIVVGPRVLRALHVGDASQRVFRPVAGLPWRGMLDKCAGLSP